MLFFGVRIRLMSSLMLFSICSAAFAYGFSVSQFRIFPYQILRDARSAGTALIGVAGPVEINGLSTYRQRVVVPTVFTHAPGAGQGSILISAGADSLREYHPDGCMAWIMDRNGNVQHVWKNDPHLWKELEHVTQVPGISGAINPVGLHVFEDGGLLATFHGYNTFPFAIGIARFDCDSQLLWKRELLTHHCFTVAEDGRIFVPALEVVDSPIRIGETAALIESDSGRIYHDVILILDADGSELDRISVQQALTDSGWPGHLIRFNASVVTTDDPLHLNDVRRFGEAAASRLPGFAADDLLISLRNINFLGVLDPHSRRFKWVSSGATVGQHSPRLHDQGVLVLDNLGGDRRLGGTRLVHIDFRSGLPSTVFPRADVAMPDLCRTANSGYLDLHPDGLHALMAVSHEGAVWEVNLQTAEVVWEYLHVASDGSGTRRPIGLAKYVREWPPDR